MQIQYSRKATKYINAADKPTKQRLKMAIEKIPKGDIKKLKGTDAEFRLRVGDLRVLFTYNDDYVIVNDILPRGQAYKRI